MESSDVRKSHPDGLFNVARLGVLETRTQEVPAARKRVDPWDKLSSTRQIGENRLIERRDMAEPSTKTFGESRGKSGPENTVSPRDNLWVAEIKENNPLV
jgi:hypothetical protein